MWQVAEKDKRNYLKLIMCGCHSLATSELMCSTMWSMYLTLFRLLIPCSGTSFTLWHPKVKDGQRGHLCYVWSDWRKVMSDFDLVILNMFSLKPLLERWRILKNMSFGFLTDRQTNLQSYLPVNYQNQNLMLLLWDTAQQSKDVQAYWLIQMVCRCDCEHE